MVKLRQSYGKVFGKVMAKGYRGYGEVMFGPILFGGVEQMHGCVHRCTEYRYIYIYYIYIYDDDGDGWIGLILDGGYVCLMFFLDGLGWVHGFWMTPEWILMVQ